MSFWNVSNLSCESEEPENTQFIYLGPPNINEIEFAPIQNDEYVEISAVENERTLWIRSNKYDEKYYEMMSEINVNVSSSDAVTDRDFENNSVVLVKYSGDYSRGIVLDKKKGYIQLMDIGSKFEGDMMS